MPLLSAFTPCGMLAMSSKPSHAERFYDAMVATMTGRDGAAAQSVAAGSRMDGFIYAAAMAMARARYALEHAGHEIQPTHVTENIAKREDEYDVPPADGDNLATRRAVLTSRRLLPLGCAQTNVENALSELLGDDFLAYLPTELGDEVNSPATIGTAPMNLQREEIPNVTLRLVDEVSVLGSRTVRFDALDPATATTFESDSTVTTLRVRVGDKIVVSANAPDMAEVVTVAGTGITVGAVDYRSFTATFTKPHAADAVMVVGDWPYWHSTKRQALVVLDETAAQNGEKRRKVHELMARMAREVSRWQIAGASVGVAGPFKVGVGKLGVTPIGTVTL